MTAREIDERFQTPVVGRVYGWAASKAGHLRDLLFLAADFAGALLALKGSQWKYTRNLIYHQIIFSGIDAIYVVSVLSAIIGGVVMVELMSFSPGFQTDSILMNAMVGLIIREIAPIFSTLILVGRSGSAIAVELGGMRVKRQDDALEIMGINVAPFFHMPRIIGMAVSNMMLNGYFVIMALVCWIAISSFDPKVDLAAMLGLLAGAVRFSDVMLGLFKGLMLGSMVAIVCIHHGMSVKNSATEIPQRTSRAIMESFMFCFVLDGVLSVVWHLVFA